MTMFKAVILIGGIAIAATAAAGPERLERADTDGDGLVTFAEFEAAHRDRIARHFERLDSDGDGVLTADEREAAAAAHREGRHKWHRSRRGAPDPERIVEKLDSDGSGSVSLEEFGERRFAPDAESFYAADANGDGELDSAELEQLMARRHRGRAHQRHD